MRTRSRRVAMLVLVLVLAMLTSGCFQLRLFKIKGRYSLPPGTSTAVQLDLYPMSLATGTATQVVVLIGLDQLNYHSRSLFDLAGNWGGPTGSTQNNAMRDFLRTAGNCQGNGIDAGNVTGFDDWYAFVANDVVDTTGITAAQLADVFRLRIRVERKAGTTDDSFGNVMAFVGFWGDDGDGVVEAGEAFCNSMMATSIPFRSA